MYFTSPRIESDIGRLIFAERHIPLTGEAIQFFVALSREL